MNHHVDQIKKTTKEAQEFRPGLRDYYVSTLNDAKNAFLIVLAFGANSASAQITITIPKFPKFKKPKVVQQPKAEEATPEQPKTEQPTTDDSETSDEPKSKTSSAPKTTNCESDAAMNHHVDQIKKTTKEAQEFRPGLRDYYVSTLNDAKNKKLEAALLPHVRKEMTDDWENSPEFVKCIEPALNELAAVARKTLPTYMGPAGYTFGTPAEKKVLISGVEAVPGQKVLKVGLKQANWMIAKDSYNFPTARFKYGSMLVKYPNSEYCWVYWINLVQDYAGGGTYGDSYGSYIERSLAGCPAGAK
jgi:hypothetical protein